MSKITIEEIERVAKLARIGVTPDEATGLAAELDAIVKFVEQLQQVDIEGVKPTDQVTGLENVTRADVVKPAAQTRDELLANAPQSRDGYIVVKRVLNG
jgi:aspartyl-tRNA(Asn)/glutamyl-tRNA(Gln) amidotransferase subunit C